MTQSIDDYLRRAEESLSAAELLLEEDFAGFAASRAYYAMFYLAEAFLSTRGLASSKHSGVVGMFGHEFAKSGIVPAHFHRYLIRAGELRLLADYHSRPISDEEAQIQIDRGREFLEFARQYFAGRQPTGF
jgi:uncharacterized protein (UPF0332 family)